MDDFTVITTVATTSGSAKYAQLLDDIYTFHRTLSQKYSGVSTNPPPVVIPPTGGTEPPVVTEPPVPSWWVERNPSFPTIGYYHNSYDVQPYQRVATTWRMGVLEISDEPDNKLLVYNKNGIQIWVRLDEVRTATS